MYWRLTDTVPACVASGRVLFLVWARDRYLARPPACDPAFAEWLSTPDMRLPERCRESLVALNVAEADAVEDLRPIACSVDMPIPLDTEPLSPVRVSPAVLLGVGRAVFSAWRAVRPRQLGSVRSEQRRGGKEGVSPGKP